MVGASVAACGDPATVLEPGAGVFDPVALAVKGSVVGDQYLAAFPGRDSGLNIALDQCVAEPVGIVAPIRQQGLRR